MDARTRTVVVRDGLRHTVIGGSRDGDDITVVTACGHVVPADDDGPPAEAVDCPGCAR